METAEDFFGAAFFDEVLDTNSCQAANLTCQNRDVTGHSCRLSFQETAIGGCGRATGYSVPKLPRKLAHRYTAKQSYKKQDI